MKKPHVNKGREEIPEDVEDIFWWELNQAEKNYITTLERLEISYVD